MTREDDPGTPVPPTSGTQHVVIVGAGLGGIRTAESLRQRGHTGPITILGAEPHAPYDRPPLSKTVLVDQTAPPLLRTQEQLDALDLRLHLDTRSMALSVEDHTITTSRGTFDYDIAIIATGSVPRRLPHVDGHVLRTVDDAHRLRAELKVDTRLVIIGAGLIGCEVAASARAIGVEVALVDVLAAPAIRVLGRQVGDMLAQLHADNGVELHLGVGVSGAEDGAVRLTDGTVLKADTVLEAIGATPADAWLANSGLGLEDGVVCDADGRAAPDVFAVGDVARWAGVRHEHWTNVTHQASHVAATLLGETPAPSDVAYWWSDQYGLKLQGLGQPAPDDDVTTLQWGPKSRPVAVYSREGRLTGLVGFSAPGAIMRQRADVASGTDVAEILARLST